MLRYPIDWSHGSGFTLNDHLNSDGTVADNIDGSSYVVVDRALPSTVFRETLDPYHLATGGSLGRAHRGMTRIDLAGRIELGDTSRAEAEANAADKVSRMKAMFDPGVCLRDSPTTEGAFELDFSEATGDTATYPAGRIDQRYYCRPLRPPTVDEANEYNPARKFDLSFIAPDPRAYEQTQQTLTLTVGTPSGNVVNRGNVAAPLQAVITMAGAGNVAYTITRAGIQFVLDLTSCLAGDVVTVTFEASGPYGLLIGRSIKRTRAGVTSTVFSLKLSGPGTWLDVPVGTTVFTVSNAANTSTQLRWYSARS